MDKDLTSQVAWGAWFRPHSSPSPSPHVARPSNAAQMSSIEDEETQDPNMENETTQDDLPPVVDKRKRPRGPNKAIPTPTNPDERILITILHDEKFVDPKIVRIVTKIIQLNFSDAWPTWKKIPDAIKEEMWKKFQATEFNRKPTYGEVFDRTHKRDKGRGDYVDNKSKSVSETYSSTMSQKYGPDETNHPEFDPQAWCDAIGGLENVRYHVYGFGTTPRGKNIFSTSINAGSASYSACSPTVENRPAPTNDDNLCEEVNIVKNKLNTLENSQDAIMKYLHNITKMLNPCNLFSNFSIGPSQPTGADGDKEMQGSDSDE